MEGLAKKRVTLDPLAEPAVMTANIGRGQQDSLESLVSTHFCVMPPLPCWLRGVQGYDVVGGGSGWFGHCWEAENLKQPLVSGCDRCCWLGCHWGRICTISSSVSFGLSSPPFYFLFCLFPNMDHRLKHTNRSLREVSKKNPSVT